MPALPNNSESVLAGLKSQVKQQVTREGPLWQGPEDGGPSGGITYSMLSRFLVCRERFRLKYVVGLEPADSFNHKSLYGDMWHVCEEAFARAPKDVVGTGIGQLGARVWESPLTEYARQACKKYPLHQEQVEHWYQVCKVQFPVYVEYWAQHPDVLKRTPLLAEQVFQVPYQLPSGRVVYLKGKLDSVDLVGEGKNKEVWLQENKSKGDVNGPQIVRQLAMDLQTMMYLTVLKCLTNLMDFTQIVSMSQPLSTTGKVCEAGTETVGKNVISCIPFPKPTTGKSCERHIDPADSSVKSMKVPMELKKHPIVGVRYNVIRRPLSGGTGTIRRHKAKGLTPEETPEHFYMRLRNDYLYADPASYFFRWQVLISEEDIQRFKSRCLDPILEQLCDWYDYTCCNDPNSATRYAIAAGLHYVMPFGVYSPLLDGGESEYDNYLQSGSELGLVRKERLFEELQ